MKVLINVNDDLIREIDEYVRTIGVSRSRWCAQAIGEKWYQTKFTYKTAQSAVDNLVNSVHLSEKPKG